MHIPRHPDRFVDRHIGPDTRDVVEMLEVLGKGSLDALIDATVPAGIRLRRPLDLPPGRSEYGLLQDLREIAGRNQVFRSYLGMGYSDTVTPAVIQRNILENPGWYHRYTPDQAEISQGRLGALLNCQTLVIDLAGLPVANASLLDEGTAAAEAMSLVHAVKGGGAKAFFVASDCHPQTIEVVRTRAEPLGWRVVVGDPDSFDFKTSVFGALVQYPSTDGRVRDLRAFIERVHRQRALAVVAADLLSLCLLTPPGELGADVAVGSSQRFGVPLGYGGPHAAYFACREEHVRHMPGRIIGVSQDAQGRPALRMALQTREQHIRREKATSNICTAQALLAIIAGMYAVYHGQRGLKAIAQHVHGLTALLAAGLRKTGFQLAHAHYFDTLAVKAQAAQVDELIAAAAARRMNFRRIDPHTIGISLDETCSREDVENVLAVFGGRTALDELAVEP